MTKFTGRYADYQWVESFIAFMSARMKPGHGGCISERACDKCRAIHYDSICLCIGAFVCSECGFDNGEKYKSTSYQVKLNMEKTMPFTLLRD